MGNIAPTLSEIKSLYEEKDGNSHRGVTWQDPVSLKTIITLFEKADSSTLIHEIAHYCFNSMEEAIRDDDIWLKLFITGNIFTKNKQKINKKL